MTFARRPKPRHSPSTHRVAIGLLLSLSFCDYALGADDNDDEDDPAKAKAVFPTTYLDLRTYYTTLPANTLSIGFGGLSVLGALPSLSSPSSRTVAIDAPLTIDLNDRFSLYGGVTASASQVGTASWTSLAITS